MNKVNGTVLATPRVANATAKNDEQLAAVNAAKRSGAAEKAATSQPSVQLSAMASEATSAEAPVDRSRVEAIRSAIASGNYPVDAAAIADRLLAFARG